MLYPFQKKKDLQKMRFKSLNRYCCLYYQDVLCFNIVNSICHCLCKERQGTLFCSALNQVIHAITQRSTEVLFPFITFGGYVAGQNEIQVKTRLLSLLTPIIHGSWFMNN